MKDSVLQVLDRIEKEEKEGTAKVGYWSIPRQTAEFLYFLVLANKPNTILELGSSVGYSTLWLASAGEKIGANVFTTEKFEPKIKILKKNVKESQLENIILIEGNIKKTLDLWDKGSIDFVFIDADKKSYLENYIKVKNLLSPNGIIIADNVVDMKENLTEFLDYIRKDKEVFSTIIKLDNGLALINKK